MLPVMSKTELPLPDDVDSLKALVTRLAAEKAEAIASRDATIAALKPVGYEVFNIGSGQTPTSLNKILSWIELYTEKKAKIVYKDFNTADILTSKADISKARKILGWDPTIAVKDGLHLCIEDYLKNNDFTASVNL